MRATLIPQSIMAAEFNYTKAVVCGVAASLPGAALRLDEPGEPVNLEKARKQHDKYVKVLRTLVEVHEVPSDDRYPDCVFVEDPVVVCGTTALITNTGHESRRGESVAMEAVMKKLGLEVVKMSEPGVMDGGDVLFTGREFFVGLSKRTNQAGLDQLASAFPDYPVTGVPVQEGLHLKSFMSMASPDCIAISTSTAAKDARKILETKGKFKYQYLEVPDDTGANCLYVNGTLFHVTKEDFPRSFEVFESLPAEKKVPLSASELNKVDGCFTCCSVLIK